MSPCGDPEGGWGQGNLAQLNLLQIWGIMSILPSRGLRGYDSTQTSLYLFCNLEVGDSAFLLPSHEGGQDLYLEL